MIKERKERKRGRSTKNDLTVVQEGSNTSHNDKYSRSEFMHEQLYKYNVSPMKISGAGDSIT